MLALIAMVIFIAALFDVTIGTVDLVVLGLAFVAAHLAFPLALPWRRRSSRD